MSKSNRGIKSPASLRAGLAQSSPGERAVKAGAVIGLSAAMLIPAHALAQQQPEADGPVAELATVEVVDTAIDPNPNAQLGVPYKARTSGDERHTRPLAETPQTITVLTRDEIEDSGVNDLRQILDAQPGITIGTGENGNAFGDRYIIRGQEARSDVFVDGLRDPGMTTRESFAVEQLEISKGPNSSFAGRGTSGGAINAITKQANTAYDFTRFGLAVGTDDHVRATVDLNHAFGDSFAIRANALYQDETVPDREPASRKRVGVALSGLYTPSENLEVTLDYYGLEASDLPDLGGYLTAGKPTANVPVYSQAEDFQDSDVDTVTARVKYRLSPNLRLTSSTRYGRSRNGYVVTGARGATTSAVGPGGVYTTATLSTHQGYQDVDYLANQTNLYVDTTLFGRKHDLVFGVEYTDHGVLNGIYRTTNTGPFNCATGTSTTNNNYCVIAKGGGLAENGNNLLQRTIEKGPWDSDWTIKTASAYVMDTFDLTDRLTVFSGVRADNFDFHFGAQNTNTLATAYYDYSDTLVNGHLGLTFDLADGVIVYATAATAADINGGESDVGTSSGYGGTVIYNGQVAGADPETSVNLEVGTKWNLFDERLLFTAAAFQSTKSDVMEGADYDAVGTFNTGENRVRGVELGMTGKMSDKLTVQMGMTLMKSKVLASTNTANIGKTLSNFAEISGDVQLRYQWNDDFYFGSALRFESQKFAGQPDTAAVYNAATGAYTQPVPGYAVVDAFAAWQVKKDLELRLNVNNVTDEDYYLAAYRGGTFLYKGDARAARLTLNYEF